MRGECLSFLCHPEKESKVQMVWRMQGGILKNKSLTHIVVYPHSSKSGITTTPLPFNHRSRDTFNTRPDVKQDRLTVYFIRKNLRHRGTLSEYRKTSFCRRRHDKKLQPYLQGHKVFVKTNCLFRQVLKKPDLVGRMMSWEVDLSRYDI